MIITQCHLRFWVERKTNYLKWAEPLGIQPRPTIDELINTQVAPLRWKETEAQNAMTLIRIRRRRMTDREAVTFGKTALISNSRRAFYARILRKMDRAKQHKDTQ